jgi:hypothetical protein
MPSFSEDKPVMLKSKDGKTINLDWYSAKHNVLTIYYCFYITHELMKPARQWASNTPVDSSARTEFINRRMVIKSRLDKQVLRLYAFMGLAMKEIDDIRKKYRPNGFVCSLPGLGEALTLINSCTAIQTKSPFS